MISVFTQEEVDAIEHYNSRQEGAQDMRKLYSTLLKKLSALDRVNEYLEAVNNEEKLRALAEEFGLTL